MVKIIEPHKPLTRFDLENKYHVRNGVILTYGEFFEEMVYVPYFWDLAENRKHSFVYTDDHRCLWRFTTVTGEMLAEFPELFSIREVGVAKQRGQIISWIRSVYSEKLPV